MNKHDAVYHFISRCKNGLIKTDGELFHQLCCIIKDGHFIPRPESEAFGNNIFSCTVNLKNRYPVCFYDLKLGDKNKLKKHMSRYSKFGIGIERKYILEEGGNPVFYCYDSCDGHGGTLFYNIFSTLNNHFKNDINDNTYINAKNAYEELTAFVKSFNYTSKDFYDENEWRFIAKDEKSGNLIGDFVFKSWVEKGCSAVLALIVPKKYKSKLAKEVKEAKYLKKAKIIAAENLLK